MAMATATIQAESTQYVALTRTATSGSVQAPPGDTRSGPPRPRGEMRRGAYRQADAGEIEGRLWRAAVDSGPRAQGRPGRDRHRQTWRQQKCRGDVGDGAGVGVPAAPQLELQLFADRGQHDERDRDAQRPRVRPERENAQIVAEQHDRCEADKSDVQLDERTHQQPQADVRPPRSTWRERSGLGLAPVGSRGGRGSLGTEAHPWPKMPVNARTASSVGATSRTGTRFNNFAKNCMARPSTRLSWPRVTKT